jgi:glycosyltransferase involved in cell wall biosynthesis
MGRSILEALSAGTFVIAGRNGALHEIVTEDRGLLIDLTHSDRIVNKIEKIIENPPNKLPFIETYSWNNTFEQYEGIWAEWV